MLPRQNMLPMSSLYYSTFRMNEIGMREIVQHQNQKQLPLNFLANCECFTSHFFWIVAENSSKTLKIRFHFLTF